MKVFTPAKIPRTLAQWLTSSSSIWLMMFLSAWVTATVAFGSQAWIHVLIVVGFLTLFIQRDVRQYGQVRALREMNRKLTDVNEITEAIRGTVQLEPVLRLILVSLTRELGYDRAFIFLREVNPENQQDIVQGVIGLGVPRELLSIFRFPLSGHDVMARTARENQSFTIRHAKRDPMVEREFATMLDLEEFATVPLEAKGQVVGVLVVDREAEASGSSITPEDLALLNVFANQAAIAIENAKLYAKVERLSITDGLTGLFNHRYFQEQLMKEWDRANRLQDSLSLIMMDLDDFKRYNDRHGHQAGDELLKSLASLMRASVRKMDVAARYGGEEFAVLLPSTDHEGAMALAEKIRAKIESHAFQFHEDQPNGHVSVSAGVASFPEHVKEPKTLVTLADRALYRAKRSGKNRVVCTEALTLDR